MSTWAYYDTKSGRIVGHFSGRSEAMERNVPDGCGCVEGRYDPESVRIVDGEPVDWVPPKPSDDHVWSARDRRWRLSDEAAWREAEASRALAEIKRLEAKQARALRSVMLDPDDAESKQILADIESGIAALRPKLSPST